MDVQARLHSWIQRRFVLEKLDNPAGYVLASLIAVFFAGVAYAIGLKFGIIIASGLLLVPVLLAAMFNHLFGLSLMLVLGFFVHLIGKYTNAPVGTSMDGLMFLMLFGMLVVQSRQRKVILSRSPITVLVIIWIIYNLLQGLNPWAESKLAWLYTVRTMALLILVYFIAMGAFSSLIHIKMMLKIIIALLCFSALYGLKQEYFGFSSAETAWIYADELRFQLLFQWTRMRIFSVLNDPTTFGIMMAYGSLFCLILATGPFGKWQRIALVASAMAMFLSMVYTGTRTAFAVFPVGVVFYVLITLTRKVLIGGAIFLVLGSLFMMKSTGNPIVFRIQSAFKFSKDESMQVRFENQKFIQPFIQSHPIGVGLGSTGVWGKRFTPDSWLASFPHDSGYVRIAVEQGWIGLLIYLSLLFFVLKTGLHYYIRVKDPTIKHFYLGILAVIFTLTVASYPQEIIVHLPSSLIFYIFLAALVKLKDFDPAFSSPAA